MSTLKDKAQNILDEKELKILPENIKNGVKIFDVTGTYSGSGSGDVKLFETIEEMKSDVSISENDLALVYKSTLDPIDEESEFAGCIFPNKVVLDKQFSEDLWGSFRSIDGSWFDGMIGMSSSYFDFRCYMETGELNVYYTSDDGITYTRVDGGEEKVEFGVTIKWEDYEPWNSVIGNFMQIDGNYYGGLFKAYTAPNVLKTKFMIMNSSDSSTQVYMEEFIEMPEVNDYDYFAIVVDTFQDNKPYTYRLYKSNQRIEFAITQDTGYKVLEGYDKSNGVNNKTIKEIYENGELIDTITYLSPDNPPPKDPNVNISDTWKEIYAFFEPLENKYYYANVNTISVIEYDGGYGTQCSWEYKDELSWHIAKNQFDATSKNVWEAQFLGKNGVENGTLQNNTNLDKDDIKLRIQIYSKFDKLVAKGNCDNLCSNLTDTYIKFPNITFNDETTLNSLFAECKEAETIDITQLDLSKNVTSAHGMFVGCANLKNIIGLSDLDLGNVESLENMFISCVNIESIDMSGLDTSKVRFISSMFVDCPKLENLNIDNLDFSNAEYYGSMFEASPMLNSTSLNSILSAIKTIPAGTKTLEYIGLTQEQAQVCTTLSNWSACQNAGWSTGY